jgi:hypothetical protein
MSYVCKQIQLLRTLPAMRPENIAKALHFAGEYLRQLPEDEKENLFLQARSRNPWFIPEYTKQAFEHNINWLKEDLLLDWIKPCPSHWKTQQRIGLVLAGNLPLVGFHDVLAVLITGHHAIIKPSSQDEVLLNFILKVFTEIEPQLKEQIYITERLKNIDAVIATGSNNTSRYFDAYFGKYPHIIRRNRTSVGIISGKESKEELLAFYQDMFSFFGLGCRNVSKIYIPKGYDPTILMQLEDPFQEQINHHKYLNNYEYNKSIYLVNGVPHFDNGHFLLKEDSGLHSPLSVIYYEYYENVERLKDTLNAQRDSIQCIVSSDQRIPSAVSPGKAQYPELSDYADNVNTLEFLTHL